MANNLGRFQKDLDHLSQRGEQLYYAMLYALNGRQAFVGLPEESVEKLIDSLPRFEEEYEAWYSECLVLLKQLLPDRQQDFVAMYEKPRGRKEISQENYVLRDYLQGLKISRGPNVIADPSSAAPQMRQQVAIVRAAKSRFTSSLFELRQLLQADLFDAEIDSARELHKHKFHRAAGAVAGVVLEKHLAQVCEDHNLTVVKKNPGIADFNELLKANGTIDVPQWRHISFLADIRNICDHNKSAEPTADQVSDLLFGVDKVLKTIH